MKFSRRSPRPSVRIHGVCVAAAGWLTACMGSVGSGPTAPATDTGSPAPSSGGAAGGPAAGTAPGTASPPGAPAPSSICTPAPRRLWKLTPAQYGRSVASLFPAVSDAGERIAATVVGGQDFSNDAGQLSLTGPHVNALVASAWQIAADAAADPGKLLPCLNAATPPPSCWSEVATVFGGRAFRRDLGPHEIDRLAGFAAQRATAGGPREALRQLLMYLLAAPEFLFRSEMGGEPKAGETSVVLTDFEKAASLAYWLTDGPPDAALLDAARRGQLSSKDDLAAQTRRLLRDEATAVGFAGFFRESFQLSGAKDARKDAMLFPQWNDAIADDLGREAEAIVSETVWKEGAKLHVLFDGGFTMLNSRLAEFYGVPAQGLDATSFRRTAVAPKQRAGIFTTGALMAAKASDTDTSPVMRGLFARESLLCGHVPPPPSNINNVPPQPDGKRTQRERLATHSVDPTCAGCHSLMDPLGLAFETFDPLGRYRTMEVGKPIDGRGKLDLDGAPFEFDGAIDLLAKLGGSAEVQRCFVARAFQYASGRAPERSGSGGADRCTMERLEQAFATSGGDMVELAVNFTTDESFFVRRVSP